MKTKVAGLACMALVGIGAVTTVVLHRNPVISATLNFGTCPSYSRHVGIEPSGKDAGTEPGCSI
ncbi:hypothetical protein GCM10025858_29550 [Alicyclobacillus sacchari]|uniref:hypothetical protein n=1 Tax=Alicyclobacillus sacchari TaxID=392010 RepID=UPI0023EA4215|nr:hypothetical protein [Alicyclobacillus sacchari]GMA58452.1 hypothetical protein GCM10025858_29550 [Alicyclobacillus sacchari]